MFSSEKDYYRTEDTVSKLTNQHIDATQLLQHLIKHEKGEEFVKGETDEHGQPLLVFDVGVGFSQSNPPLLLQYRDRKYLLRQTPDDSTTANKALRKQFDIMSILGAKSNIPVPRMYHYCSDATVIGRQFYVMQFIAGRVFLNRAVHLPRMSNTDRAEIYDAMCALMANLHAIDITNNGLRTLLQSSMSSYWKAPKLWTASELLRTFNPAIVDAVALPADSSDSLRQSTKLYYDRLNRYYHHTYTHRDTEHGRRMDMDVDFSRLTVIHGDIHFENVIWHPSRNEILALLDWETCTIGNPLFDLVYFTHRWQWRHLPRQMSFAESEIPLNWTGLMKVQAQAQTHSKHPNSLSEIGIPTELEFITKYVSYLDAFDCENSHSHRNGHRSGHHNGLLLKRYHIMENINKHYNFFCSLQIYRLLSIFCKLHQSREQQFEKLLKKFPIVVIEYFNVNGLNVLNRKATEFQVKLNTRSGSGATKRSKL